MRIALLIRILLLTVCALAAGACSTARPVVEWQDETFVGQLNRPLVIAVVEEKATRRAVEDAYVARFAELSIAATAGYGPLPETATLSRETVEAALDGSGIDAVLVTRLIGVEEVEEYYPPTYYDYYGSYDRYFLHTLPRSNPGYYRRYRLLKLETTLYDTRSGKLVWSMQSESMDSPAPQDIIKGQVELTVKRLAARGLVAAAQ